MRGREIERGLPTAIDLLTLALTAGMNLYAAMQRVARELRYTHPALAEEFDITRRQAELSSLEYALRQLADRVRLPEVRNLAIILAQSERLGSDATTVLLETSNNLRTSMRQRAEAQANRASFWMLIPTIVCFLVGAGLLIVGPVMMDVTRQLSEVSKIDTSGKVAMGNMQGLRDSDPLVRIHTARLMGKIEPNNPTVVSVLIAGLHEKDVGARRLAAESLGTLRPRYEAVPKALTEATRDPDATVRAAANQALRKYRGE